jgi:RNase P subunit RPR2
MGVETHTQEHNRINNTHTSQEESARIKTTESQLKIALKSISNESTTWSQSLKVVVCSKCACILLYGA